MESSKEENSSFIIIMFQVHRFLQTYSSMASDIPADSLAELEVQFSRLSSSYLSTVGAGLPPAPELVGSLQAYLSSVRDACRATWARFNPLKMAAGLVVLALGCLLCLVLSELSGVLLRESGLLKAPVSAAVAVAVGVWASQLLTQGYVEVWCCLRVGLPQGCGK